VEEVGAFDVSVIRIARNNSARGAESAAAFFTVPFCYLRVPMRARARISVTYLPVISGSMKITYFTFYPKALGNSRLRAGVRT